MPGRGACRDGTCGGVRITSLGKCFKCGAEASTVLGGLPGGKPICSLHYQEHLHTIAPLAFTEASHERLRKALKKREK